MARSKYNPPWRCPMDGAGFSACEKPWRIGRLCLLHWCDEMRQEIKQQEAK